MILENEYRVEDLEFYGPSQVRELLIVGHPRFGSGYISNVLKAAGVDVGHERVRGCGTASWMFAVDDLAYPYGDGNAYHKFHFRNTYLFIRDPIRALPSCIVENTIKKSYSFRKKHIHAFFGVDLDKFTNNADRAAASIIYWYKMCELKRPSLYVRIDDKSHVRKFLIDIGISGNSLLSKAINTPASNTSDKKWKPNYIKKNRPALDQSLIDGMSHEVREKLFLLSRVYGYESTVEKFS